MESWLVFQHHAWRDEVASGPRAVLPACLLDMVRFQGCEALGGAAPTGNATGIGLDWREKRAMERRCVTVPQTDTGG
jgi:hypothetical protein